MLSTQFFHSQVGHVRILQMMDDDRDVVDGHAPLRKQPQDLVFHVDHPS